MTKMSFPASAIGEAPKTGAAIKEPPAAVIFAETLFDVSGWTVELSMYILSWSEPLAIISSVVC